LVGCWMSDILKAAARSTSPAPRPLLRGLEILVAAGLASWR
jgi:hypothetical protein